MEYHLMNDRLSIDVNSGLLMSTPLSKASEHDTNYFQYVVARGIHTKKLRPEVYADKGYHGHLNREFLHINDMADVITHKDERNAMLTELEIKGNKMILKVRYKIEQYFGVTALHQGAGQAWFITLVKEGWDRVCHARTFKIKRSLFAEVRKPVPFPATRG